MTGRALRSPARPVRRRWHAPEVVQTSSMDCGPAALKSLLEGYRIRVSYGRLREACQTDVDGTSIDTLEVVANGLGIAAEQVMIPADHLLLDEAAALPAMVVVRQPDGATHFVVVWRRVGAWLQVMDPASGRRWVRSAAFLQTVFRHDLSVPSADWREWAASDDFVQPLQRRLVQLGATRQVAASLIGQALAVPHWFALGTLDACVRLVASMQSGGGLAQGDAAVRLVQTLCQQTFAATHDIFAIVPPAYWSVVPDPRRGDDGEGRLLMRGVVLMRVPQRGARAEAATTGPTMADRVAPVASTAETATHGASTAGASTADAPTADAPTADAVPPLGRELAAALAEKPVNPLRTVWRLLREDGLLAPSVLVAAVAIAVAAMVVEAVLFRGLFDLAWLLNRPDQRMAGVIALLGFVALLLAIEAPIVAETLRMGRTLETRLRMALLSRLPQLDDRYFHSRPVSDMAERSHGIHVVRGLPNLAVQCVQVACELGLTLAGIVVIDPASLPFAAVLAMVAIAVPALLQPLLNERDLRMRSHAGALHGFHLDALLGLVPIRAHRAARAVARQHEALLVEWARAGRGLLRFATLSGGLQSLLCTGLSAGLLIAHFVRAGGVDGSALLLVFWTLKLPATGQRLAGLALQYPAQRNMLLRLLEPLNAPRAEQASMAEPASAAAHAPVAAGPDAAAASGAAERPTATASASATAPVALQIDAGRVLAGGHVILDDITLSIAPGEHVAIVGASGAGKSSLVGLLLGWHRLAQGRWSLDGAPACADAVAALRRHTAWVDPAVQLWNQSLADNVGYACEGEALARLGPVIDAADLRGLLQKLPAGLQSRLGEGGGLLSGGEGQRVRLARALLQRDVRLVLLDEPFRGLDRGQRATLLAEARQWWQGATLLCVTHDVAETAQFDRVLVIEDGRLVEDGTPAALAAGDTRYRALLDAEAALLAQWARGGSWRRLVLQQGRIVDADTQADGAGASGAAPATGFAPLRARGHLSAVPRAVNE